MRLGFLCSHNGSGMQAVVRACREGRLAAEPAVVISNNPGSGALTFAASEGLPHALLNARRHPEPGALDAAIADTLRAHGAELVVMSGYMKKLGPAVLGAYAGRIVNIHPALLPKYGGQGMFGLHVHEAVLAAGDAQTGVTIHLVDADYDTGPILAQASVPVLPGDTPESLRERVLPRELTLLVETLQRIASGEIRLPA